MESLAVDSPVADPLVLSLVADSLAAERRVGLRAVDNQAVGHSREVDNPAVDRAREVA